jgi:hypothetical protein
VPTYVIGTFYISFFCYQGYDIPVSGKAHCRTKKVFTLFCDSLLIHPKLLPLWSVPDRQKDRENSSTHVHQGLEDTDTVTVRP